MYGEIEYKKNDIPTKTKLVAFEVCKGADSVIYHIGMRKNRNQDNETSSYNIKFPPLGTTVTVHNKSSCDEYDSTVLAETDYMIQLWDGGLQATITLYK